MPHDADPARPLRTDLDAVSPPGTRLSVWTYRVPDAAVDAALARVPRGLTVLELAAFYGRSTVSLSPGMSARSWGVGTDAFVLPALARDSYELRRSALGVALWIELGRTLQIDVGQLELAAERVDQCAALGWLPLAAHAGELPAWFELEERCASITSEVETALRRRASRRAGRN